MDIVAERNGAAFDEHPIRVGKDILELLSSSMYVNPLTVYREYVQNAADSIDEAIDLDLLNSAEDGRIEINLDWTDRRVLIRDNGAGIPNEEFGQRMLSFGASKKRGTEARGFRGVGRLSGLGYAQKIVFRSRASETEEVLEAVWDCRVIKQLLGAVASDFDLETTVRQAVSIRRSDGVGFPAHFFEVELIKPKRIGNDRLMNEAEIDSYLAQTCPCPFSPDFPFATRIQGMLASHIRANRTYNIFINGSSEPVCRPFKEKVEYSDTKSGVLRELIEIRIEGVDGELAAVGWLIHHDYQGAIPSSQGVRGLRARVGNIQIGNDRIFSEVFPEDRFCSWTIGELHVLDSRITPNGRRDDFEINSHFSNVVTHLRPYALEVARECRLHSRKRVRLKDFELSEIKVFEKLEVIKQGAISLSGAAAIKRDIAAILGDMKKATQFELFADSDQAQLRDRLTEIESAVDMHSNNDRSSGIDRLPQDLREAYQEVFDLIYECSVNKIAAKSLIDRMLQRLSRT